MEFDAALVAFFDQISKRIENLEIDVFPVTSAGIQIRIVHCVVMDADMENHGVKAVFFHQIKHAFDFGFELGFAGIGSDVAYVIGNPNTS